MLVIILLPVFMGLACAQETYVCECALYYQTQIEWDMHSVPLEYLGRDALAPGDCDMPVDEDNKCSLTCQNHWDKLAGDLILCDSSNVLQRCHGSIWCEILNNQEISNVYYGTLGVYYRVPSCETAMADWNPVGRQVEEPLCCEDAIFKMCDHEGEDDGCTPSCVDDNLCECGLFAQGQFSWVPEGNTAIPLVTLGIEVGDKEECEDWPSPDYSHICDQKCLAVSNDWIAANKLDDIFPDNEDLTYGQAFCYGLYSRRGQDWPAEGLRDQQLRAHGRMPGCGSEDGSHLQWNERVYDVHEQLLCCDMDGEWEWCPT